MYILKETQTSNPTVTYKSFYHVMRIVDMLSGAPFTSMD